MTWIAARSWCEDQNLEMLSIHDADDQAAAQSACPTTDNCWIGLYCDENADSHCKNTNDWKWADGSAFSDDSYTNWKDGQPNNNGGVQDCILMKGTEDWLWVDFGCNTNTLGLALCHGTNCVSTQRLFAFELECHVLNMLNVGSE